MYIGRKGLESNKPPMPFYGDVWRQTVSPPLWIAGLHNVSKLTVRDLQPVPEQDLPILMSDHIHVDISDNIDDDDLEVEPAVYDSDDDNDDEDDDEDQMEDVQKVMDEDNGGEANEDWEDVGSFGDGVFDDDDLRMKKLQLSVWSVSCEEMRSRRMRI